MCVCVYVHIYTLSKITLPLPEIYNVYTFLYESLFWDILGKLQMRCSLFNRENNNHIPLDICNPLVHPTNIY